MSNDGNSDEDYGSATLLKASGSAVSPASHEATTVRPAPPPSPTLAGHGARDPVIGTQVSGYVVKGRLGSGGMGIVYEGEQPVIGKRVAIKVLRPEVAENPDVVQRLVAEARAVNQVGHRGIIDVFGFGQLPDGRQCIVMEYLEGQSLEGLLDSLRAARRQMPLADALTILDELLSALAAAHSAGVVHRDLKPSNIFLCRQRDGAQYVKVLDFGIAKLGVLGATPQTNASLMVGTPAYMAPEQARNGMVSAALDLYAVGCIAYELVVGEQPFVANSVVEMIMKHQEEPPVPPSQKVLSLPDFVDVWVLRLLEKKPEDRYASAEEARRLLLPLKKELTRSSASMSELAGSVSVSPSMRLEAVRSDSRPQSPVRATPSPARKPEVETQLTPALQETTLPKRQPAPVRHAATVVQAPPDLPESSVDEALPPGARPKTWLYAVAAVSVLGLMGGAAVLLGGQEAKPTIEPSPPAVVAEKVSPAERAEPPPSPVQVAPPPSVAAAQAPGPAPAVEAANAPTDPAPGPTEVAKAPVEPAKAPVEVVKAPVEAAKPPPTAPTPRPRAPASAQPVVAKVAAPPLAPHSSNPTPAGPKSQETSARLKRVIALEARLQAEDDQLNLKLVKKIRDRLQSSTPPTADELSSFDSRLNAIEESL
ncbi:MAG: protein kinase [Myxococcaceae bacterium]|nr:protein kinase [Myxococcaceae bacterium]